jgi:hypothetical protein
MCGRMELHQALENVLMWVSHETLQALADRYIVRNRQKKLMFKSNISKQARARNTNMHFDLYIGGKHYTSQMVRNSIPHRPLHVIPNQVSNKIPLNSWRLQKSGKTYPLRMERIRLVCSNSNTGYNNSSTSRYEFITLDIRSYGSLSGTGTGQ